MMALATRLDSMRYLHASEDGLGLDEGVEAVREATHGQHDSRAHDHDAAHDRERLALECGRGERERADEDVEEASRYVSAQERHTLKVPLLLELAQHHHDASDAVHE